MQKGRRGRRPRTRGSAPQTKKGVRPERPDPISLFRFDLQEERSNDKGCNLATSQGVIRAEAGSASPVGDPQFPHLLDEGVERIARRFVYEVWAQRRGDSEVGSAAGAAS